MKFPPGPPQLPQKPKPQIILENYDLEIIDLTKIFVYLFKKIKTFFLTKE